MFLVHLLEGIATLWILAIFTTLFLSSDTFFWFVNLVGLFSCILLSFIDCLSWCKGNEKLEDEKMIEVL